MNITVTIAGIDVAIEPEKLTGDFTGNINNTSSDEVEGVIDITDQVVTPQTDEDTTYGTFSINTDGEWTYELNTTHDDVEDLDSADDKLYDTIMVTIDGETSNIIITISGITEVVVGPGTITPDTGGFSAEEGGNYTEGYTDNVPEVNCTTTVDSISALKSAASYEMTAGTTLCLADGTYSGFEMNFGGQGTADAKITIAAEHPGQAIIDSGSVQIYMSGQHVVLQGFVIKDGDLNYNVLATRGNGQEPCHQCRITEMTITDMDGGLNDTEETRKWFEIYGSFNRFDHNWISGKTSRGALFIVDRTADEDSFDEATFEKDYAQIDYNYFGERPPIGGYAYASSGDNEYEGIRIGLSTSHSGDSFSVVENNFFERIQGENEIISNKASNNTIRNNTIHESYGSIVNRHGHESTFANNFIFADDFPYSGGIRVSDDGHTITNNYIQGVRYPSTEWNGGIVLAGGNGSGDMDNGYQDVENVFVAHNTIIDSMNSFNVMGGKESTNPDGVYFINNIIADAIGDVVKNADDMPTNPTFAGNYVYSLTDADQSITGMTFVDVELVADADGIYRPDGNVTLSADNNADIGDFTLPTIDMDGQIRSAATISGADEVLATTVIMMPLTDADVGPKTYVATPGHTYIEKVTIANHDFDSGDFTGWTNNGAVITTAAGEVFSRGSSLKVDSNASDVSQTVDVIANTDYTLSAFMKGTAQLAVTVGGETFKAEREADSYGFNSVTFNSGSGTSAVITARVDDGLAIQSITDSDFVDFKAGGDAWTKFEGDTDGDVGTSSNSASGSDGSAKLGYTTTAHVNASPNISQTVTVEPNKDYDFSFDLLIKDESVGSAVILNITGDDSIVIADTELTMSDMTDVDLDDYFERFSQSINSVNNTSLTITLAFSPQAIKSEAVDTGTTDLTSDSKKANELRVDNVSLTAEGAPTDGTEAFFDSIRLVSVNH